MPRRILSIHNHTNNNNNMNKDLHNFQTGLHSFLATLLISGGLSHFPKKIVHFLKTHCFCFSRFWFFCMASLRVGLGRGCVKMNRVCFEDGGDGCWARGGMVKFGARGGGRLHRRLRVVSGGAADSLLDHKLAVRKRFMDKEDAVSGKVDQWIRDSVDEIVSNIEEAPFLVHIYPENDLGSSRNTKTKVVREKAEANSWPNIKHRWERGSSIPNGIALVEELKIDEDDDVLLDPEEELGSIANDNQHCSSTKVFGIVIQERGLTCPACYILKTSRVRSIAGICTHFCMFRVECFGETPDVQLKKQWLL